VYKRILQDFDFEPSVCGRFSRDKMCACDKSQCTDAGASQFVLERRWCRMVISYCCF